MARTCLTATTPVLTVEPLWTEINMSREGSETFGAHLILRVAPSNSLRTQDFC